MLAIKNIDIVEVDRDRIEVSLRQNISDVRLFDTNNKPCTMDVSAAFEVIEGRRFVNANGKEFCIGMSKQVQDAIGLPFEAFKNMEIALDGCRKETIFLKDANFAQTKEICSYNNAGFWKRLGYAFSGNLSDE